MIWVFPSPICTPIPPRASTEYVPSVPACPGTFPALPSGWEFTINRLCASDQPDAEKVVALSVTGPIVRGGPMITVVVGIVLQQDLGNAGPASPSVHAADQSWFLRSSRMP
jgi:hypothetical protein